MMLQENTTLLPPFGHKNKPRQKGLEMVRVRWLVLVVWYVWEVFGCQVAFLHGDLAGGPQYAFESLLAVVVALGLAFPVVVPFRDALGVGFATSPSFFDGLPDVCDRPGDRGERCSE